MPILDIRALPQPRPDRIEPALHATCRAVARAYGCTPREVWATWTELPAGRYVEGDAAASVQPEASHPPLVRLLCFEGKSEAVIEATLEATAAALCAGLELRGNVFVEYVEARSGRVIAGDGVVRR